MKKINDINDIFDGMMVRYGSESSYNSDYLWKKYDSAYIGLSEHIKGQVYRSYTAESIARDAQKVNIFILNERVDEFLFEN